MAQPGSLQIPRQTGGRSRFSKALPEIPTLNTSDFPLPPKPRTTAAPSTPVSAPALSTPRVLADPKTLPDLPPPPPPPHNDDPRTPIQFTPLPPLPKQRTSATATSTTPTASVPITPKSGPPKMMIPRRPVGSKKELEQTSVKSPPPELQQQRTTPPPQSPPQKQAPVPAQKPQPEQEEQTRKEQQQPHFSQLQKELPRLDTRPQPPPKSPKRESQQERLSPPAQQQPFPTQYSQPLDYQYQQPLKSPSESLSSLLSAYSRSDTASIIRSSDGTAYSSLDSNHNDFSYGNEKPKGLAGNTITSHQNKASLSTIASARDQQQTEPDSLAKPTANGSAGSSSPTPPPPPSKDDSYQRAISSPRASNGDSKPSSPSTPRQQIWRRRSFKGSRELPSLRLDHSHGSTASTSTISTIKASQPSSNLASTPSQPPSGTPTDLGRELAPAPPAKDNSTMGHGGSKIKQLKEKFHVSRRSDDSQKASRKDQAAAPAANRPPTPEYQQEDPKTPVVNTFVSPISPASSPEPQRIPGQYPPETPQIGAGTETSQTEAKPIARKAVAAPFQTVQPAKSLPDLKTTAPPITSNEPLPPVSARPGPERSSSPAPAPRGRQPGPPVGFRSASRTRTPSAARPDSRASERPFGPSRFSGPETGSSRWARSSSGDLLYKGRDGTLYPEMKVVQEPDPKAFHFPHMTEEPIAEGTVLKASPLKDGHYNCFQKHKTVVRRPNKRHPLACQACEKADAEDRWSCTFCSLRICESCLKTFEAKNRDLRSLTTELFNEGTISLSSPTRPASALGLEINF